jgi:flagellar hook-associated protein 2
MSSSSINLVSGGLDVQGIVDNLIYVEQEPIRRMQKQSTQFQNKINAFQNINTKLSSVLDKVNAILFKGDSVPLQTPYSFEDRLVASVFSSIAASSSDESAVRATGTRGSSSGSFSISVSELASAQTSAAQNVADVATTTLGTGTISIQVGSGTAVDVTIDSSNNTLEGIRKAINAADAGVTATIVNDGTPTTPYRLIVSSNDTGTANTFTITPNLTGGAQTLSFSQVHAATNASFDVNGIAITKSSNTVSDVIDGVTLNLVAKTTSPVIVSVKPDADAIVAALQDLASTYNDVNSVINAQSKYDPNTKTAGILSGDSTVRSIQTSLQTILAQAVSNSYTSYAVLGQVGFQFNRDGSATINESKLRDALDANPIAVAALFLGDGTTPSGEVPGVEGASPIVNLRSSLKSLTDSLSGPIHNATDGLNTSIRNLQDRISSYQERLDARRELLVAEYSKADEALKLLSVNQNSLAGQLSALSKV